MRTTFGRLAAIALIAALASFSVVALAADGKPDKQPPREAAEKPTDQQNKMKYCNARAGEKNLKGEERKAFMSSCLKG